MQIKCACVCHFNFYYVSKFHLLREIVVFGGKSNERALTWRVGRTRRRISRGGGRVLWTARTIGRRSRTVSRTGGAVLRAARTVLGRGGSVGRRRRRASG